MTDVLAPEIREALVKLDERKSYLIDLQPSVEIARELCVRNGWPPCSVDPFPKPGMGWPPIVVFSFASSVKDVAPHLKWLADNGHRQSGEAKDIGEVSMRMWRCGNIGLVVMMGVAAGSPTDGPKCRYVEVGKKEIPIYELQCEDGTKPPELALPTERTPAR